jgi:hypothetical protein
VSVGPGVEMFAAIQISVSEDRIRRCIVLQNLVLSGIPLFLRGSDLRIHFDRDLDQLLDGQRGLSCRQRRRYRNPPNGK